MDSEVSLEFLDQDSFLCVLRIPAVQGNLESIRPFLCEVKISKKSIRQLCPIEIPPGDNPTSRRRSVAVCNEVIAVLVSSGIKFVKRPMNNQ